MAERLFDFGVSLPEQDRLIGQVRTLAQEADDSISRSQGRSQERRTEQAKPEPEPEKKREKVVFTKKARTNQVQKER